MEWGRYGGLDGELVAMRGEPEASTQQGWAESRPPAATCRWKMATLGLKQQ